MHNTTTTQQDSYSLPKQQVHGVMGYVFVLLTMALGNLLLLQVATQQSIMSLLEIMFLFIF